jgi:Mrp family chromosome partitioning ATPase
MPLSRNINEAVSHGYEIIAKPGEDYGKAAKALGSWAASVRQTLGVKRIAVTGLGGQVAVDTAAACAALARALSAQKLRPIVVDITGAPNSFAPIFGLKPQAGLSELLAGRAEFESIIARDMASEVHVIGAGKDTANLADLLSGSRFAKALAALDTVYDEVILNCGELTVSNAAAVNSAQAVLLLAVGERAADAGRKLGELRKGGIVAAQYVRLNDAGKIQSYQAA